MSCFKARYVSLFVLLFLFCETVVGSDLILNDSIENVYFWEVNHEMLIDSSCSMVLDELEKSDFIEYSADDHSQMERNECRWYKIVIENRGDRAWLLELSDAHISEVQLFKKLENGFKAYPKSGSSYTAKDKSINHKNHVFELNLAHGKKEVFYLKLFSSYPSSGRYHLRTVRYYFGYALEEYYLLGAFYGMLLIMLVYSLLMYISTKDWLYINYVWYLIGCSLFTLGEDAIGSDMLWNGSTWPNHVIFIYGPVIWLVGFMLYANSFLRLRKDRKSLVLSIGLVVLSMISVIAHYKWHYWIMVIGVVWAVYLAYNRWKSGLKYARFFVIGYGLVLIGLMFFVLRIYDLLDNTVFNYYVTYYGFIIQALVFAFAMSDRIKQIKLKKELTQDELIDQLKVNDELKDKVNRELEQKVEQRTEELVSKSEELLRANQKLEELSKELYEMNTVMDKENWQLQKVIKASKEQKVVKGLLSFEEFSEVFPDNITCLKFLADLKWVKGYQCKKCGHLKFMNGEKHHSRKCSKCKYDESAMAGTLFHGVRFDLVKAFYICYHTVESKKRITAENLSKILGLRKNTCWSFRKKVIARLEKNVVDGWQDLVVDQ